MNACPGQGFFSATYLCVCVVSHRYDKGFFDTKKVCPDVKAQIWPPDIGLSVWKHTFDTQKQLCWLGLVVVVEVLVVVVVVRDSFTHTKKLSDALTFNLYIFRKSGLIGFC